MSNNEYDFAVIGGGSAGYAAARTAVDLGLSTVVIDGAEMLGGLCILRGCMPSKTLIESANRYRMMREAKEFGLRANGLEVKPAEIIARKRKLIGDFAGYRQAQLEDGRFDLARGHAKFTDAHTLHIDLPDGGSREVKAKTILIATGSVISSLPVPGLSDTPFLTSDEVLEKETLPKSIIVLGGGAIALEMAHYYAALDVDVTIIQRSSQLLRSADQDVAEVLQKSFEKRGVTVHTDTCLTQAGHDAQGKWVEYEHQGNTQRVTAEELLVATGRRPNTESLALDMASVDTDRRGGIEVSAEQRTNQNHIFAAGDPASPLEVVHIAIAQGENAAHNASLLVNKDTTTKCKEIDYRLKLFGIFTAPEIGMVGLTEREAQAVGKTTHAATYPFDDHGKSMVSGDEEGFVKLVADDDGTILGGAVIGPHAVEIIHEITVAMHYHGTVQQLAQIPHYHPTLSEIWTYPAEEIAEKLGLL